MLSVPPKIDSLNFNMAKEDQIECFKKMKYLALKYRAGIRCNPSMVAKAEAGGLLRVQG